MKPKLFLAVLFVCLSSFGKAAQSQPILSLADAILTAQSNDAWQRSNQLKQQQLQAKSLVVATLPDPKLSIGMANLPIDNLSLSAEPMTQVVVGVSQQFARGDSLNLSQQQWRLEASKHESLRQDRRAKVESSVTRAWLAVYLAQQSIVLIEQDQILVEQMLEVARANYANTLGGVRQTDVINAQLQLTQLQDKLNQQQQGLVEAKAKLSFWLDGYQSEQQRYQLAARHYFVLPTALPSISLLVNPEELSDRMYLSGYLSHHPMVKATAAQQRAADKGIALAEQGFQPQWGVNAAYGYRDGHNNGDSRSDFFSVGVTFDLPIFTQQKQQQQVVEAVAKKEQITTEKLLLVKQLLSQTEQGLAQLANAEQRRALYQTQVLPQSREMAEAALKAYTHDDGSFSDALNAKLGLLKARLTALQIDVQQRQAIAHLNYLLTQAQLQE